MYVLDTDILSNLMTRSPPVALLVKLASVPAGQQSTTSITVGEIVYGARRLGVRGQAFLERLETLLHANLAVLPFDTEAAHQCGSVRAELERQGTLTGDADTRIASIALARGLAVATANTRHFSMERGLPDEDWPRE